MIKSKRARFSLMGLTLFILVLFQIPLLVTVLYSFFTLSYSGDATSLTLLWYNKLLQTPRLIDGLKESMIVATANTFVVTILGTLGAFALERTRLKTKHWPTLYLMIPLLVPEIVFGLSLLGFFIFWGIPLGTFTMIIAHITFSIPYAIFIIRARLKNFDVSIEDAAKDLGANSWQTFRLITLPLISPAILSAAVLSFILSFDDFLISFFTTGVGTDTLPLVLYGMIRSGLGRETNALSSLFLLMGLVVVFLAPKAREKLLFK
jgi:spermidine/putrescine transport system permease protein